MEPLEDSLREVYARKTPPADFTARVMLRVRSAKPPKKHLRLRWAMVGAIAASLFVGVYVSRQRAPIVSPEADGADAQLLLSLQIAGAKINKARDALMRPAGQEPGQRLDQPLKIGN